MFYEAPFTRPEILCHNVQCCIYWFLHVCVIVIIHCIYLRKSPVGLNREEKDTAEDSGTERKKEEASGRARGCLYT